MAQTEGDTAEKRSLFRRCSRILSRIAVYLHLRSKPLAPNSAPKDHASVDLDGDVEEDPESPEAAQRRWEVIEARLDHSVRMVYAQGSASEDKISPVAAKQPEVGIGM
ncbi:hypothetical protein BDZ91DRAFT_767132 [Kalaharituber pfeilii]|nr:hypothetical protein BDZ91DRAFT_767132 [Kalaharituber pfeilii]